MSNDSSIVYWLFLINCIVEQILNILAKKLRGPKPACVVNDIFIDY